jgi:hypothetical protein
LFLAEDAEDAEESFELIAASCEKRTGIPPFLFPDCLFSKEPEVAKEIH